MFGRGKMGYTPPPRPHAIPWVVKYRDGAAIKTYEIKATSEASARGMTMTQLGITVRDIIEVDMVPQRSINRRNSLQSRLL